MPGVEYGRRRLCCSRCGAAGTVKGVHIVPPFAL